MTASQTSLSKPSAERATSSSVRVPAFARTVRFRLTIWYSSLLLVFGISFVVALNVALRMDTPSATVWFEDDWVSVRPAAGQAFEGAQPIFEPSVWVAEAEAQIAQDNLDRLQTWSILSVLGLALASGIGGYVLSGMMLRPVRDITRVASTISATNLNQRINHQGPDDELRELADTFDSMILRLETAFESQRRFVQYASHELRTPLAAIRTNIEVTEMDPDVSQEEYRALMETVKTQTERLTRLSDDLLLLTSTEAEPPPLDVVEAGVVCEEAVQQLQPLAERKDIAVGVDIEPDALVYAHADLLYRCVFNLVDNAIKYSGPGTGVLVSLRNGGNEVTIDVSDSGPGIPEEHRERVFDRFFRVDKSLSRQTGGSGLGLAIVKELVEVMGGSVGLRSAPGEGSTFTITLEVAHSEGIA
jgi:signal transduction histidine kinase